MIKIADKFTRAGLSEGRTYQMGFAFLKKLKEDSYETVQPVSPCKDYLNDIVFAERNNKRVETYGLKYDKRGIFDGKAAYLAIKICENKGGRYPNYEKDKKNLKDNFKNIQKVINWVEDQLKVSHSELLEADNDVILVKMDNYWVQNQYYISLYTLLLRMSQWYNGEETPRKFLNEFSTKRAKTETFDYTLTSDVMLWTAAKIKLKLLMTGERFKDPDKTWTDASIHNSGVVSYTQYNL